MNSYKRYLRRQLDCWRGLLLVVFCFDCALFFSLSLSNRMANFNEILVITLSLVIALLTQVKSKKLEKRFLKVDYR